MANPQKPPTSVRSIRLPEMDWQSLQAQADSLGVSLNRYVAMRLEGAKRDIRPTQTPAPKQADAPLRMPRAAVGSLLDKKAKR